MNSAKSFHLRWNNHLSNLRTLLEYLYNEQSFVDVTLSCSDGFIRAHKLVLSACSPYFDTIFRDNPCKHPTVILRGISLREMQLIIEYMYVGAVDIPENDLTALLEIANELQVKGLVQDPVDSDQISVKYESHNNHSVTREYETGQNDEENKELLPEINCSVDNAAKENHHQLSLKDDGTYRNDSLKIESDEPMSGIMAMAQINMNENGNVTEDNRNQADNYGFEYSNNECKIPYDAELHCTICNRGFLSKQNMKRHMQTHSGFKPHKCNYCSLSFLRLSHLQRHHRVHTGERPFLCDQCDKQFSRSDKLKQHIAQHHSGVVISKQPKQRGRPRKVPSNIPLNLMPSPNRKISPKTVNNVDNITTYQTLQQIYNIPNTINGISVMQ